MSSAENHEMTASADLSARAGTFRIFHRAHARQREAAALLRIRAGTANGCTQSPSSAENHEMTASADLSARAGTFRIFHRAHARQREEAAALLRIRAGTANECTHFPAVQKNTGQRYLRASPQGPVIRGFL